MRSQASHKVWLFLKQRLQSSHFFSKLNCTIDKGDSFDVIKNKKNAGFAAANNIGVKNSSGNYLLFANPDIEILPRSIDLMMGHLKNNSDLAAVAPQIISEDGSIYPSC